MESIYRKGEWIASTVERLTHDEHLRKTFFDIIERTVGDAANQLNFPYDRYYAPDGVGRPEKLQVVGQWLCAESRLDPGTLQQPDVQRLIREGSLDEIWTYANVRLLDTGFSTRLPKVDGDERVVLEFEDGFKIVEIIRPEAVRNEYHQSGISGGVGNGVTNLVLRDRDNASMAALVVSDGAIHMRGPDDHMVPFHITETYLLDLIKEREYKLSEPTAIHFAVQISDGRIFDVRDIPDGSRIDGSLWLHKETGRLISRLPDDLTVDGDFGIFNATYLRKSPRNLKVNGNAGFVECSGLTTISEGFKATGYTHLETCDNLAVIEDHVEFDGVHFSGEVKALDAKPFKARRISLANYEVDNVPRNKDGLVTIPTDFVAKAVARQTRKEIAQLPGLAASVLVDELKQRIRKGVRSAKQALIGDKPPAGPKV